ncbi:MAG: glycosyl transferase [Lachnospiraceae bacterium]|nr:glycosyl transferase [Lachnospiraceae bacterium]
MLGTELLKGQGLGNQLFCYVTARCIAKKRGMDFAILGGETLANNIHSQCGLYFMDLDLGKEATKDDFINGTYWEHEDRLYIGNSKHDMTHGCYVTGTDWKMYETKDNTLLMGNMQAEDYFREYKDEIKEWLKVKPEYDCYEYSRDHLCILHLRCSDYLDCPELFLRRKYWLDGMKHMKTIDPQMEFMIITNDVKEASKILPGIPAYNFDLAKDYTIIKNAKYLLLANSSFTCFPAFCSETVQYILAPKYWARHNVSNGYWASEQNIYDGWHYMDRHAKVFTSDECRAELEAFKKNSKEYARLNQRPEGAEKRREEFKSKLFLKKYRIIRFWRSVKRKLRIALKMEG